MFADLLVFMLGGAVGFFTAALCKAASRADAQMEKLQMTSEPISTVNNINGMEVIDPSEGNADE